MSGEPRARFSAARRSALNRVGATGLALWLPACGPSSAPQGPSGTAEDFTGGALRLDLRQRIADGAESFELEGVRYERQWPGRRIGLTAGRDAGDYRLSVHGSEREEPIFRQGFDTGLSAPARSATTQLSLRLPLPARPVRATIEKRRVESTFTAVSSFDIDPRAEAVDRSDVPAAARASTILASGAPAAKVDIAILGDGYREAEYSKFVDDAARAADCLFSVEPLKSRRSDFNVRSVFAASADSGVTDAYLGLRKDTVLRCAYGSAAAERTLVAADNRALREIASAVPYDFLLILANARRYGGSAYFGGPAVVAIDSARARYLVIHELAHAMAGLADEYYVPVADGPVYGGNVEPWHPNVTIAPQRAKWSHLLAQAPRPTPWNKAEYDRRFALYVQRYNRLREAGASEAVVEKLMQEEGVRQAALLARNGDSRKPGCFEGANGYARGMFRSGLDCIMFSLQAEYFCPACADAVERTIDEHSR